MSEQFENYCKSRGYEPASHAYAVAKDAWYANEEYHVVQVPKETEELITAALQSQSREGQAVKGGWQTVPRTMTPEMRTLMLRADEFTTDEMWIMLLAAPTPPQDDLAEVKAYAVKLRAEYLRHTGFDFGPLPACMKGEQHGN
jgi:hypothetical protein